MPGPQLSSRQRRPPGLLDAGPLGADIASFRLHLAAEGKSARTVQGYTPAVRWFAATRQHALITPPRRYPAVAAASIALPETRRRPR